jgi:multiple sugar transport system substrate-binding protein
MNITALARRQFLHLLALTPVAASACVRGSSPRQKHPNELVWTVQGSDTPKIAQTATMWNEAHPQRPVRIERLPDAADLQRIQLGLELNAQGDSFDVLSLDVIWTGEFAEYGWIEPLDEFRAEAQSKLLAGPLKSAIYRDRLWAMPHRSDAGFLYYRTDLVPRPPKTWDEAVTVGTQAARKARIAPYVGQGAAYEGLVVNYLELLWGAGGDIFGGSPSQVVFNTTPAARTAAEFMRRCQQDGFYAPGFTTMLEDPARITFGSGQAVFMRNWPSYYTFLQNPQNSQIIGRFSIAPLPVFNEGETASALGGVNLAVSTFSRKKETAKEFIRFASLNEQAQVNLGKNSLTPILASAYQQLQDNPVMRLQSELLAHGHSRPPVPFYNDISLTLQQQIFPAYTGQKPIPAALDAISGEINSIVKRRQQIFGQGQ